MIDSIKLLAPILIYFISYSGVTQGQDLIRIDYMTPHQEVGEGEAAHLQCLVTNLSQESVEVIWQRRTISPSGNMTQEQLAKNGRPVISDRVTASRRVHRHRSNHQFEYNLVIKDLSKEKDEGMYDCKVISKNGSLIAARHSLVAILPQQQGHETHLGHFERSDYIYDESSYSDDYLNKSNETNRLSENPVTARFVIARKGMDVVLECHDAADDEIMWEKQGEMSSVGRGKHLRLFRVDRWDSGLYYCSTNTTRKSKHQVTLRVDTPPRVSTPGSVKRSDANSNVATALIGESAILRCKVEATPVPQITWYRELPESTSLHSPILDHRVSEIGIQVHEMKNSGKLRALHSGEEYGIQIDAYKDGMMETSLHIRLVDAQHLGNYLCHAKNQLGEDEQVVTLVQAQRNLWPSSASSHRYLDNFVLLSSICMMWTLLTS